MKILKKILTFIGIFIGLVMIAAIFVKREYSVEREVVINKPKQQVFEYVKLLKNQGNYSKWATMDPKMKKEYTGTDGTVGFISSWDSEDKQLGRGEQEISKITEGERIDYQLRFFEPMASVSPAYMTTESVSDSTTKVKWGMSGTMAYPTNVVLMFMDISEILGRDLTTGLTALKGVLEK
jgi:Polyketide cyclase / dehydrase and lipid transport